MTQQLIDKQLQDYAESMSSPESSLLDEIAKYTEENVALPVMLSGFLQGRILSAFSSMIQPKYILELGTYTGYSALCMAEGMQEDGKLVTLDKNADLEDKVRSYFARSPYDKNIEYILGDAREIVPTLDYDWDMVFMDADKKSYGQYFDLLVPKMKKGSYIIADNVLYNGEVVMDESDQSKNGKAIEAFNNKVKNDPRVKVVMLPLRDGLSIIEKTTNN